MSGVRQWVRHFRLDLAVVASLALAVAGNSVSNWLLNGWLGTVLGIGAFLVWMVIRLWLFRQRPGEEAEAAAQPPALEPVPASLGADAEQAERWQVGLGLEASGMAAAEWFETEEPRLRRLVTKHADNPAAADALALICDALDTWYVRQRRPADLLHLAERLAAVAHHASRRDLKELAAARAATAYRMLGELDSATRELGRSAELAARGRTAAAVRARREVEWALSNLSRADASSPGADRAEHLTSAQDRLADAAAALPRADLAGDTAIHLNLGLVALYRAETGTALDHLRLAAARALTARDVGTQAHAHELAGVVAWSQDHHREAAAWWQRAEHLYAEVAEHESRARCLQHLGSAALRSPTIAAQLRRPGERAEAVPLRLLEASAGLRAGTRDHPLLQYYLEEAGTASPTPAAPTPAPGAASPLREAWRRLLRWLSGR